MRLDNNHLTGKNLQIWNASLFAVLLLMLLICSTGYWRLVLSLQLTDKADVAIRALAGSYAAPIAAAIATVRESGTEVVKHEFNLAANRILLLMDPNTSTPFIVGLTVEIDYEVLEVPFGSLDLSQGNISDPSKPFKIPVYDQKTGELFAIAGFYPNPEYYRLFSRDIYLTYSAGVGLGGGLIVVFWTVLSILLARIQSAEKKLREKQAQIIHAGKLAALGEMAAGIAHEINQPLAIIRIGADGLTRYFDGIDNNMMESIAVKKIVQQVNRAADIIAHMRSFVSSSTIDADNIDLSDPILKSLSFFQEQFRIHGIKLCIDIENPAPTAVVNASCLEQISVNFLSNARYAVEQKARSAGHGYMKQVGIKLYRHDNEKSVIFEVWDNGQGMCEELKQRCLEPFYTTKEAGQGMGLGLSIAHTMAKEMGFELVIESQEMQGSCFRLVIPIEKTDRYNRD